MKGIEAPAFVTQVIVSTLPSRVARLVGAPSLHTGDIMAHAIKQYFILKACLQKNRINNFGYLR